jgi:hypothetical protein
MTTTLFTGGDRPSHIELPVLPRLPYLAGNLPILAESILKLGKSASGGRGGDQVQAYDITYDAVRQTHRSFFILGDDTIWCRVKDDDPATASLELSGFTKSEGSNRRVESRVEGSLRSTVDDFILDVTCTLLENEKVVKTRQWKDTVRRELV